jgi:uncharacterized membrane protein YqiK
MEEKHRFDLNVKSIIVVVVVIIIIIIIIIFAITRLWVRRCSKPKALGSSVAVKSKFKALESDAL